MVTHYNKAKRVVQRKARPAVRKASKALIGAGKVASSAGYKGTGRKVSRVGRAGLAASRVTNMRQGALAMDKMRSSFGR